MSSSTSISFKEVETLEERKLLRSIAEPVWRNCYAEILSQEQMCYMLDWMYAVETIENGYIIEELMKGYMYKDKVLKYSKVIVCKK